METAYHQFTVEYSHNDTAVGEFDGPVHNQYIIVEDARVFHRVAFHAEEKSGGFVADELFVEVDAPFHVIIGRCPETGGIGGAYIVLAVFFAAPVGSPEKKIIIHGGIVSVKLKYLVLLC